MKFARGLAIVSWVSLPLAIACGSAGTSDLFSSSGGATSFDRAGANGVAAGTSSAGADTAGMSAGGTSEGGARGGEPGVAGKGSAGVAEPGGGSPGAGAGGKGHSGGSAGAAVGSGGASAGAGGTTAGAGGSTAGADTGGAGGIVGNNGGASGSGHGAGCPPNGAPMPGGPCQVTTVDSCFYSGIACSCQQVGASTFVRKWACYGTPDKCPDKAPESGSGPCKSGAECPYPGGDFCACVGNGGGNAGEPKYSCQPAEPPCPEMKPLKGMDCQLPVRSCAYADDQCFCNGDGWTCESNN